MTRFEHELRKVLAAQIERERVILESPTAIKNFEEYKYHLGRQLAFKHAVDELIDEANTNVEKG